MAPIKLHDEIWGLVIAHLRVPLPTPDGKNDMAALRQADLCTAMRVSKVWNNYAGPLLYKRAVTPRPKLLARDCDANGNASKVIKGIRTKRELLGLIEILFLEYWPEGSMTPSYPFIMHGREVMGGPNMYDYIAPNAETVRYLLLTEAKNIHDGARSLAPKLAKLRGIATGAFMGGRKDVWPEKWANIQEHKEMSEVVMAAQFAVSKLIDRPSLVTFCQRVERGPLAYLPVIRYPNANGGQLLQHRLHIDSLDFKIPVLFNGVSRWYISNEKIMGHHDVQFQKGGEMMVFMVNGHLERREMVLRNYFKESERREIAKNPALRVELLLPPKLARGGFRELLEQDMNECRELSLRELGVPVSRSARDTWNTSRLEDAPPCEVCGWCSDDIVAREYKWLGDDQVKAGRKGTGIERKGSGGTKSLAWEGRGLLSLDGSWC